MRADVVLRNGRIVTMADDTPAASAIAIRGDRILAVGSDGDLLRTAHDDTRVIDLGGRTVVPGLIDAHTHLELAAYARHRWTDVRGLSRAEVLGQVREKVAGSAPGTWIVMQGTFGQDFPDRAELDKTAPDNPVAVRWTMHKFQLNSCALELAGIDRTTVAPPGVRIHHGAGGHPTGLIEEGWDLLNWPSPMGDALADEIAETARELFLQHGVTTIHDIAASAAGVGAYTRLAGSPAVLPRIGLAFTAEPGHQPLIRTPEFVRTGLRTGFGGPMLRLSAIKIFVDGGRDGAFRSTGLGSRGDQWGLPTRTPQGLAREITAAVAAGTQVWVHAIGDLAQEMTISAIEQAVRANPGVDHRTRIEHFGNEIYDARSLQRLVRCGGIPAPNPSFLYAEPDDPDRRIPPGVQKYGLRTLLEAGTRPPGNSDTAGAQPRACNPWFTMQRMVERRNQHGTEIDAGQRISVAEALRSFTVDAAVATFLEHDRGSLVPGKLADLAVLNKDPFSVRESELESVTSVLTVVGGRADGGELWNDELART
ncbi:amidohydrolase [Planosporangium flavigriseum]|uniref:Amidohydrolase n=1 Tax=Planosporangium flavigriseum TaxID=373681 RepID=A0A8J3LMB7_9ACTN|nr:amidohydrolase [Planosporangium flavigriseum]NJC62991.1 amidohydrolase [Planosporangium flavigriseum]GIG73138.1 amidohydrolase [Planosporangium flavigriseum]